VNIDPTTLKPYWSHDLWNFAKSVGKGFWNGVRSTPRVIGRSPRALWQLPQTLWRAHWTPKITNVGESATNTMRELEAAGRANYSWEEFSNMFHPDVNIRNGLVTDYNVVYIPKPNFMETHLSSHSPSALNPESQRLFGHPTLKGKINFATTTRSFEPGVFFGSSSEAFSPVRNAVQNGPFAEIKRFFSKPETPTVTNDMTTDVYS